MTSPALCGGRRSWRVVITRRSRTGSRQRELAAGTVPVVDRKRPAMGGLFAGKIDELVERSGGKIRADVAHDKLVARCEKVAFQIKRRVAGEPIKDRLVSLADPDARPIRKGKLGKPTRGRNLRRCRY